LIFAITSLAVNCYGEPVDFRSVLTFDEGYERAINQKDKPPMSTRTDSPERALTLPERTKTQLDELIRAGQFPDLQVAVATAVDRLYTETQTNATKRQQALSRLNGALRLGTTRESLREAEQERLDWESEPRRTHGPSSR
jgi:hypothetical protein